MRYIREVGAREGIICHMYLSIFTETPEEVTDINEKYISKPVTDGLSISGRLDLCL